MSTQSPQTPQTPPNFPKNKGIGKAFRLVTNLSSNIKIPRYLTDKFRNTEETSLRALSPAKFDSLNDFMYLLKARFIDIKNSLSDINAAIDRNNLRIDELDKKKNNKINFLAYSKNFSNPDTEVKNPVLKNSIDVSQNEVVGVISDEDSGIEFTEHQELDKTFIKINIDDSKIDGIKFVTSSSVKINWNAQIGAYEILQNDIFRYDSEVPESEIIINHNLGTRALDVKVFKFLPHDTDLKYPIVPGMEYPSDNQIRIYLTNKQLISVLISRI